MFSEIMKRCYISNPKVLAWLYVITGILGNIYSESNIINGKIIYFLSATIVVFLIFIWPLAARTVVRSTTMKIKPDCLDKFIVMCFILIALYGFFSIFFGFSFYLPMGYTGSLAELFVGVGVLWIIFLLYGSLGVVFTNENVNKNEIMYGKLKAILSIFLFPFGVFILTKKIDKYIEIKGLR